MLRGDGLRVLAVLLTSLVLGGCSVQFLYNNADRFIIAEIDDYVDLERDQRAWLAARAELFFDWHRSHQLPQWADALREFDREVADGIRSEQLDLRYLQAEAWSDEILLEVIPSTAEFMAMLSDEQVDRLPERLAEANLELNEDYEGLALYEQREVWRDGAREAMERWVGGLTPGQELLLQEVSLDVVPDNGAWIRYREAWQSDLVQLLDVRDSSGFPDAFRQMSLNREDWYTPEYRLARQSSQQGWRRLILGILTSLDDDQAQRLSERLLQIANDFEELARS